MYVRMMEPRIFEQRILEKAFFRSFNNIPRYNWMKNVINWLSHLHKRSCVDIYYIQNTIVVFSSLNQKRLETSWGKLCVI